MTPNGSLTRKLARYQVFQRRQCLREAEHAVAQDFRRWGFAGEQFDDGVGTVVERTGVQLVTAVVGGKQRRVADVPVPALPDAG